MATPVERWVEEQARLTKPEKIYWCNGSDAEAHKLIEIGIREEKLNGKPIFRKLNDKNWPNSYFHHSHPNDVARTEQLTFVCHPDKETAGPNNNWMDPQEAKAKMAALFDGCMKGRTMYVMPYMMGHPKSPYAKACIQVTDNSYVAVSMRIMTRMTQDAKNAMEGNQQAMVSLLTNHIGMTLGAQKGAHITKDILHEAQDSNSFLQGLEARFDPEKGYLTGVTLSPTQITQMLDLARTQRELIRDNVLEKARQEGTITKVPAGRSTVTEGGARASAAPPANLLKEGQITHFKNGQSWELIKGVATRVDKGK